MNKIIYVRGNIGWSEGVKIAGEIAMANSSPEVDNIILVINSDVIAINGFNTLDGIGFIRNEIDKSDKAVIALGTNCVASAAATIFMMASRRMLLPDTKFILHKSRFDDFIYIKYEAEEAEALMKPVVKNSKLSYEILYKNLKDGDWILSEEELIKYGIVTEPYNMEEVKKLTNT